MNELQETANIPTSTDYQHKDLAIEVKDLHLFLPIKRSASQVLKQKLRNAARGSTRVDFEHTGVYVRAIDGISLEIHKGDRVGLIGNNGAGKSTFLKVLAGIYQPSSGACIVNGSVETLFTSKLVMDKDASGYENIYLMGYSMGLGKSQIAALEQDVIDFADLGNFLYLPVRTYSAGMATRLGFAVATSVCPEVLLIDEVVGAGDKDFRTKAQNRISDTISSSGTLVLASHSDSIIQNFCNKVCWLDSGQVRFFGETEQGLALYNETPTGEE